MCEHYSEDMILDYVQERLPETLQRRMDLHVEACEVFRQDLEQVSALKSLSGAPDLEPREDRIRALISDVAGRAQSETKAKRNRGARRPGTGRFVMRRMQDRARWQVPLAIAAGLLAVAGLFGVMFARSSPTTVREAKKKDQPTNVAVKRDDPKSEPAHPSTDDRQDPQVVPTAPKSRDNVAERPQPTPKIPPVPQDIKRPEPSRLAAATPGKENHTDDSADTSSAGDAPYLQVARVSGFVTYRRSGAARAHRPNRAMSGTRLMANDELLTGSGGVSANLGDSQLLVDRNSHVRLLNATTESGSTLLVEVLRGRVYVDDHGQGVHVMTRDGLFSPVGTRFQVHRTSFSSEMVVMEGSVNVDPAPEEVREDAAEGVDLRTSAATSGRVLVNAGNAAKVRAGAKTTVRKVRSIAVPLWARQQRLVDDPNMIFGGRNLNALIIEKDNQWDFNKGLLSSTGDSKRLFSKRKDLVDGDLIVEYRVQGSEVRDGDQLAIYLRYNTFDEPRTVFYIYGSRKAYVHYKTPADRSKGELIGKGRFPQTFDGKWHRLRLRVRGDRLEVNIDGRPVWTVENTRLNKKGGVALLSSMEKNSIYIRRMQYIPGPAR